MKKVRMTRREFVGAAGAAVAAFTIVPYSVIPASGEVPPSSKINIAGIGLNSQGGGDTENVSGGNNIVALCDCDWSLDGVKNRFKKFPDAKQFTDFRKMWDAMEKEIDAVVVGTPDHTHAVLAMSAIKRGKHVYCEKPLAHSVFECRELARMAKEKNVVTQLGNQGHSFDSCRMFCEWIWDGAIGDVKEIHAGIGAVNSGIDKLKAVSTETPKAPEGLDWDLWLGPSAERPYHPAFHPFAWRGWVPFGNGTIGDWTCHTIDPLFWAFDLGAPVSILAEAKDYDVKTQGLAYPKGDAITFQFAAKGKRGPITLVWHSGENKIPRPADLEADREMKDCAATVIGTKGTIMYGPWGAGGLRIVPESRMKEYKPPEPKLPRVKGGHHQDWLQAIRGGTKAGSDFSYGGPLTEIAMLGVIGLKMPGTKLEWDGKAMRFKNSAEANGFVKPAYRKGWTL